MDRRSWLKLGGLNLGALAAGLEPSLARLFAAEKQGRRSLSKDFSVILFWANGGPGHLDTFDLKPDAPAEIRGSSSAASSAARRASLIRTRAAGRGAITGREP